MKGITATDLIVNPDGSIYHLKLHPGDVADTIITVGDPGRVEQVSRYFDRIEITKSNREFITHTGFIGKKRVTVISTGIGTDNIDIVLNELDAVVNINLQTREPFAALKSLNLIRIGTSGALQRDIPVDSVVVSSEAIGLDNLMHFYKQNVDDNKQDLLDAFKSATAHYKGIDPYIASANRLLLDKLANGLATGITLTSPGFFAPQGRKLRAPVAFAGFLGELAQIEIFGKKITNFEMETAGLYGLAAVLGHRGISFNVILANRTNNSFSADPAKAIDNCIKVVLETLTDKL